MPRFGYLGLVQLALVLWIGTHLGQGEVERRGKFLFDSKTTTITSFTSTTTVTVTNTASCFISTALPPEVVSACTVRRKRSDSLVSEEPITAIIDGEDVDLKALIKPSKSMAEAEPRALEPTELDEPAQEGRGFFAPIVVLSKSTVNAVSTSVTTAALAATVTVTFQGCTPVDVMAIIGPACPP
eukprot:maker-scaffold38_size502422-snap-gene-3.22 protein:Tk05875 transcript:maker-scaffold38_size502422-snap-gene-3.22-mRNA-1 annotation:"uncharacterized protein LOC100500247"